jgi:hypothetical protein
VGKDIQDLFKGLAKQRKLRVILRKKSITEKGNFFDTKVLFVKRFWIEQYKNAAQFYNKEGKLKFLKGNVLD